MQNSVENGLMNNSTPDRWWDIPAAFLLVVAMFTAASRLEATNWANGLSIIPYLVILGTITGLALGQSRFRLRLVILFGLVYGFFFIGWQFGNTLDKDLPWKERILALISRAGHVIDQIVAQRSVTDSILFILIMAALFWLLSLAAGFTLTRHGNGWWAILPVGLALFTIHYFDQSITRRSLYLAVYVFFALILAARAAYLHNRLRWKQNQVSLPPHLGLDFIRFALIVVTLVVLISWTFPAIASSVPVVAQAAQPIRQKWAELRGRWNNAFASLRSSVGIYSDYYGDSVVLGRGNLLNDTPVFVVSPPDDTPIGIRYYWKAVVYDDYANGQWVNNIYTSRNFEPNTDFFAQTEYQDRWEDIFEIIPVTYISTLFSPGQPFWVSRGSTARLIENPDNTFEISSFRANQPVRPQQPYQVQTSMNIATISQLRLAGTEYPTWITDRYLKLPETITPRTRQLAQDITAGLETPYEKVGAITDYLRNNIEYQKTIPAVPNNQEPIDWFLFDLRKGFCNYYASAEVILLRSIGIPARWAIGYAQGERLEDGRYLVRQADAHSWPEVYFPNIGWVEFEPTVSQPDIVRLSGEASSNNGLTAEQEIDELRQNQRAELEHLRDELAPPISSNKRPTWPFILLALTGAMLLTGLGWLLWKNRMRFTIPAFPILFESTLLKMGIQPPQTIRRWSWRASLPPLTKSYQEINRTLVRLGKPPQPRLTPAERTNQLTKALPPTQDPAQRLLQQYEIATYSQETADYNIARQAELEIRNLSWKAWIQNGFRNLKSRLTGRRSKL